MNQKTYLITLNAPPLGEGDACYAAVTVDDSTRAIIAQCRAFLAGMPSAGFGNVTWRGCVSALVVQTLPECMDHFADAVQDGPVDILPEYLDIMGIHEVRAELIGLEVGPDWLSLVGYEKHGDYEFNGGLPENP